MTRAHPLRPGRAALAAVALALLLAGVAAPPRYLTRPRPRAAHPTPASPKEAAPCPAPR